MTIDDVIAVFAKVDADGSFTLDDAFEELKARGVNYEYSYDHGTSLHAKIWEHPMVTAHNAGNGLTDILNSYFFTLYALQPEHYDLNCRRYKLVLGRVGNTHIREFDLIPAMEVQGC